MKYYAHREEKKTSFKPPASVQAEARRALEWIKSGDAGHGFTSVGRGRASQLASGEAVSLSTIKRMKSYLSRHGVDKQGEGWSKGSKGYPSPGRVAWAAWGGDAAKSWVNGILGESESKESSKKEKDYDHIIKHRSGDPADKELYSKVKSEAKSKFDVYPSAVANAWVVKEYKKRGGTYGKEKKESSKWYDRQPMTFYKNSAYDKITGEWHPGEWNKDSESNDIMSFWHYPQYNENHKEFENILPNSAYNIGKGHLFAGYIEHIHPEGRTDDFTGLYDIYGRSKNIEEAIAESKQYENIHNATYQFSYDNGLVTFSHEPIRDKNGNKIGVSWMQTHFLPIDHAEDENDVDTAKNHIEKIHKFLYDRNNDTRGGTYTNKKKSSSKNWYHEASSNGENWEDSPEYHLFKSNGATHQQAVDAINNGLDADDYEYAMDAGAKHKEIVEAFNKGSVYSYAWFRGFGATHKQALQLDHDGVDLEHYEYLINSGATPDQIMDAHNNGVNLKDYAKLREDSHNSKMRDLFSGIDEALTGVDHKDTAEYWEDRFRNSSKKWYNR